MNRIYEAVGISKQCFHQQMSRKRMQLDEQRHLFHIIVQLRENHPTMCIRDMYYKLRLCTMGRDKFEQFCKESGFGIERKRNGKRTTDSTGVVRFDNLLNGVSITRIDQVWQSDITYYELGGRFYYLTFIIDAFSRRIIGHQTSKRLLTEATTLPALRQAIRTRIGIIPTGLIFHSDGGGQYYDKEFLDLTQHCDMLNSMCEYAWENGKAERINGVIKNNYLIHRDIKNFAELKKEVDRSVLLYNTDKPHSKLKRLTPMEFEKQYICYGKKISGEKSAIE